MSQRTGRILEAVGLTSQQEKIYLHLLDQPGLAAGELAELIGHSERSTTACLSRLEDGGLVARVPGGAGFTAASPDVAVNALIARKRDELRRAERLVGRLLERAQEAIARRGRREEILQIVTGQDALAERLEQLQRSVERDVLGFITTACPYRAPQRTFERACARGVRVRMVYDLQTLDMPEMMGTARRQIACGGQVRIAAALPVSIAIFDRRIALVPEIDGVHSALLVDRSAVLGALVALCETTWASASPLSSAVDGIDSDEPLIPEYDDLVTLLAAGFKDDAAARRLGLARRTFDRRVRMLMEDLQADTRFQAGWLAAHRAVERGRS